MNLSKERGCSKQPRSSIYLLQGFDSDHQMEVIAQQTIGVCLCDRSNILCVKLHEIVIIALFEEDILAIIATVVDMINNPRDDRNLAHLIE